MKSVKVALLENGKSSLTKEQKANLCLESSTISERILKTFGSNV